MVTENYSVGDCIKMTNTNPSVLMGDHYFKIRADCKLLHVRSKWDILNLTTLDALKRKDGSIIQRCTDEEFTTHLNITLTKLGLESWIWK